LTRSAVSNEDEQHVFLFDDPAFDDILFHDDAGEMVRLPAFDCGKPNPEPRPDLVTAIA